MDDEELVAAISRRMLSETSILSEDDLDFKQIAAGLMNMIRALGLIGHLSGADPIISVLEKVLEWRNEDAESIRLEGIDALAKIGGIESIAAIISYFEYPEQGRDIQSRAIEAIERIGFRAIGALASALESDNLNMQTNALRALAKIGNREAVPYIMPLLKADDVQVAGLAAIAIALCTE
jgi:HEAT repeat protein